jgi:hypothetical protein
MKKSSDPSPNSGALEALLPLLSLKKLLPNDTTPECLLLGDDVVIGRNESSDGL